MVNSKYLLLIFTVLLIVVVQVKADTEAGIIPYTMETSDKRFVFVMLNGGSPGNYYTDHSAKYSRSGLYLNGNSSQPIWAVDWAAYVFLPSDGVHVVRKGKWAQIGNYDEEAITFFAQGKPIKTYRVRDLVDFPWLLPRTTSHYEWQKQISTLPVTLKTLDGAEVPFQPGIIFDEIAHTMTLETLQGDKFIFDVETGKIISSRRPVRLALTAIISTITLLLIGVVFYFARRKKE